MAKRVIMAGRHDDAQNEKLYSMISNNGYDTFKAYDGRMALDEMERRKPDLLVTGIGMPKMDGLKLVEEMGKAGLQIPVFLVSYAGDPRLTVDFEYKGKIKYFRKPFTEGEEIEFLGEMEKL